MSERIVPLLQPFIAKGFPVVALYRNIHVPCSTTLPHTHRLLCVPVTVAFLTIRTTRLWYLFFPATVDLFLREASACLEQILR